MSEQQNIKFFGYRAPRVPFPLSLRVEMLRTGFRHPIGLRAIDISATGIGIELNEQIPLDEWVELVIRSGDDEFVRLPGRVFYQSEDRYGLAFEFSSSEQLQQVQSLISRLVNTIEYLQPKTSGARFDTPDDSDSVNGRPKI